MGLPSKNFRVVVIIIHLFSTPKLTQKSFWTTIHYPAGAAAGSCILLVSVHLVKNFLLSGNTSFSHTSLHPIPTKLGQSDRYLNHYSCTKQWWGQRSGWGHWGQKGHFHQKGIKSYRILSIDAWLMHMHKLDPLYKSYGPKNSSGVIWGHRGQKVIFTKKASSPTECVALMRDSCICISLTPSTKVITLKNCPGSFGVTGVKRSFSLKML